jgi:hypothetical protein
MNDYKSTNHVNKGFEDTSTTGDNNTCNDNGNWLSTLLPPRIHTPTSVIYVDLVEFGFPSSLSPSARWEKGIKKENDCGLRQCDLRSWVEEALDELSNIGDGNENKAALAL